MNPQLDQQVQKAVRQDWDALCHGILDRFTTTTKADLDAAINADDLVHRITASSNFTPDYVESQVAQLVGAGAPIQQFQQQQPQMAQGGGYQQEQQYQGQQAQQYQGQPRTSNRSRRGRGGKGGGNWQGQGQSQQGNRSFGSYSRGLSI